MSYASVLALINSIIVANGNNEITADVLRPVLDAMLEQPNDLVGVLADLNTSDKTSIVNAINSILSQNIANKTALRAIDTTGVNFAQDELLWVRDAVNNTAANNGGFTCELGEQMVFYCDVLTSTSGTVANIERRYYRLTTGATLVNSLGTGLTPPLMPDGSSLNEIDLTGDLVIDLGDIGTDEVEDAFNSDASQPFTITGDTFVQAIQGGENKLWQWIGGNGTFGNSATLALSTYFVNLTGASTPTSYPELELLKGFADYNNITGVTTYNLSLSSFYFQRLVTDDDIELTFTDTPSNGFGFHRRLELVIPTGKVLTIPTATIIGDYVADGTYVNQIDLYFTNYDTLGLSIVAIVNAGISSGVGLPSGGTTGQVLKKLSDTDYDADWEDESGGSAAPDTYNVKDFGAKGDGFDFVNANISSSSNNLEVLDASFISSDIGKIIVIVGAGSSGDFFKSTIINVIDSTNVVLSSNASTTVTNANGFFGTDDTSNIQSAINSVFLNGGGKLIVPEGIYIINGELQNNIGVNLIDYNSQLYIPYQGFENTKRNTLEIVTNSITSFQQGSGINSVGNRRTSNSGSVFRSTITGSGTRPSLLASKGVVESSNNLGYNAANIIVKGLNIQFVPFNNKINISGVNFDKTNTMVLEEVSMFPYYIHLKDSLQPNEHVTGVIMNGDSSGNFSRMKSCYIAGFYNGIIIGDHSFLENNMVLCCYNGLVFQQLFHQPYLYGQLVQWCKNVINIIGLSYFNIHDLDIEVATQSLWYDSVNLVSDLNNYGRGKLIYHIVQNNVGVNYNALENVGGDNLTIMPLGLSKIDLTVTGNSDSEKLESLLNTLVNVGIIKIAKIFYNTYYRFDNDLLDYRNALNGTGTNISYDTGLGGDALQLLGGSSYVTVADNDLLSFANKPWSMEFIVYFDTLSGNQVIVNKRDNTFSEYQVNLISGNLRLAVFTDNISYILCDTSGFTFSAETFYHICVTDNGSNSADKKIYINGDLQSMNYNSFGPAYTGMSNTSAPLYIGTQGNSLGNNSFSGLIQRLSIISGELSASEVLENYNTEFVDEQNLY